MVNYPLSHLMLSRKNGLLSVFSRIFVELIAGSMNQQDIRSCILVAVEGSRIGQATHPARLS